MSFLRKAMIDPASTWGASARSERAPDAVSAELLKQAGHHNGLTRGLDHVTSGSRRKRRFHSLLISFA
jgi:hypothetical protein